MTAFSGYRPSPLELLGATLTVAALVADNLITMQRARSHAVARAA